MIVPKINGEFMAEVTEGGMGSCIIWSGITI